MLAITKKVAFCVLTALLYGRTESSLVQRLQDLTHNAREISAVYINTCRPTKAIAPSNQAHWEGSPQRPTTLSMDQLVQPPTVTAGGQFSVLSQALPLHIAKAKGKKRKQMHPTFKVKSRKFIQSTYQPITKTVDTAKDLIDINLPDAFPGYRYELNPSSVHCATFLRLINDAFYMYRKLIESRRLSGNIIGWDDIKLRHRRAKFCSKHRQKGFPALVVVRMGSIDKLHDNTNDALTNKNAIVLIHCDKNTPDSSYYTLIWHPDAPEYTLTNMMAFLIRVYDNSVIFKIPAMNNVKETSERFVKELGGITGNLCNPTKSKNHNVVWAVART